MAARNQTRWERVHSSDGMSGYAQGDSIITLRIKLSTLLRSPVGNQFPTSNDAPTKDVLTQQYSI